MLSRTKYSPTAPENRESRKDAKKAMNDEEDTFKGLEEDDVEEDPVQTLGC